MYLFRIFFKIIEGKRVHIQCPKAENLKIIICEFNSLRSINMRAG